MESKSFFQYGYNRLLGTLLLAVGIIALAAYANFKLQEAEFIHSGPATISVSGEGEVLAVPDIGEFTFSVRAEGEDAASAQEASAEDMNEIIEYLMEAGIAESDIRTENYRLNPQYRFEERVCPAGTGYCPPGERVLDGFEVSQSVSVKVRNTDEAGDLISGVGERGATDISGLRFTIDDEEALQMEAREKAIADAKEKARVLAEDLGVRLVRIIGYNENQGGYPIYYDGRGGAADMAVEEAAVRSAPNVPTGENKTTSQVTITYEVR